MTCSLHLLAVGTDKWKSRLKVLSILKRLSLACVLAQAFFSGAVLAAPAATGIVEGRVKDAITHFGVQAVVKLDGPESLSFSTDSTGYFRREVAPGQYREEYSAAGYRPLRSHDVVVEGKITATGAFLNPETPPPEEGPGEIESRERPGYTLLHEYVVDGQTSEPLRDVKVRLVNAGIETQTDSRGHFWLLVPTPAPPPSRTFPGGMGTDTLIYQKSGYKTLVLRNFGIAGDEMGGVAVELERGAGIIDIDAAHKAARELGEEPTPKAGEAPQSALSLTHDLYEWLGHLGTAVEVGPTAGGATTAATTVTVPSQIRVGHNCTVSNGVITCASCDPAMNLENICNQRLAQRVDC